MVAGVCRIATRSHASKHMLLLGGELFSLCRYGAEAGVAELRELIASKMYPGGQVKATEIFVSDGSKCDIGRLQMMFGKGVTVSAQV